MVEVVSARGDGDAIAATVCMLPKLSSREKLCRGRRRRRGKADGRRRVALRAPEIRLGRLPIGEDQKFGPAPPPCGIVGLPGGAEGQAQGGVGGLFRVLEPF